MVCHKDPKKCPYQYYQGILLDGKIDNLVYIRLVEPVSAEVVFCGFWFSE
jgi:hypothetical protein